VVLQRCTDEKAGYIFTAIRNTTRRYQEPERLSHLQIDGYM